MSLTVRKQLLLVLLGLILGIAVQFIKRPTTDGSFYTVCYGMECEIRMHIPYYKTIIPIPDPVIGKGQLVARAIGKDISPAAPEVAAALSRLPGYGADYRPTK